VVEPFRAFNFAAVAIAGQICDRFAFAFIEGVGGHRTRIAQSHNRLPSQKYSDSQCKACYAGKKANAIDYIQLCQASPPSKYLQ
jgi:hypothetical protein